MVALAEQAGVPAVSLPGLCWIMVQFDLVRMSTAQPPERVPSTFARAWPSPRTRCQ